MASDGTAMFQEGVPIVIKQGTRTLEIKEINGSACLFFNSGTKTYVFHSLDYYFLLDNKTIIEKAIVFKNSQAHKNCFGLKH